MNRIEYMTKLASLLQDIPEEERKDAMKYYNDYFDEAGEENEEQVIREFGTPEEVAENIKADLKGKTEDVSDDQQYQAKENEQSSEYQYEMPENQKKSSDKIWKIILIIILAIIIGPVLLPVVAGILAAGLGIVLTVIVSVAVLAVAGVAVAIAGIALVISGLLVLLPQTAAGLALIGSGLMILVIGVIATVGFGKLCALIFGGIAKGSSFLWGKIFHRKAGA